MYQEKFYQDWQDLDINCEKEFDIEEKTTTSNFVSPESDHKNKDYSSYKIYLN